MTQGKRTHPYRVLETERTTLLDLSGRVTLESLLATAEHLYADEAYRPEFGFVMDLRESEIALDFDDIMQYITSIQSHPRRVTGPAIFVTANPANFGMARMYAGAGADLGEDIHFATTLEEALEIVTASFDKGIDI
ncbi:MAG: hypothetical protein KDI19_04800 [Pseudomonadales bacterium]|nr:hypothetical protein [Pseudomonadales bacterium]